MRAIGYVRVSTDKQADRGVSLEAQQEKIRAMATVHSADLIDIVVDAGLGEIRFYVAHCVHCLDDGQRSPALRAF